MKLTKRNNIVLFIVLDQAEQFVKNGEKCDGLNTEKPQESLPGLLNFIIKEPVNDSVGHQEEFPQFSNLVGCEDIESKSPSTNAQQTEHTETTDSPVNNEIPDVKCSVDETTNEHSNLNELLLDLSEALDGVPTIEPINLMIESSNLLDQSFTEDAVTQPLLSNIIREQAFNPSHPDALTDDELESYLAELEKEDEEEISEPITNVKIVDEETSNHILNCSAGIVEADREINCSNVGDVNEKRDLDLPLAEEEESIPLSDSEVTSTEESNGSSFSDSDSSEAHPNLHEDSFSTEEEMPQLIDDPCLLNSENIVETVPSQITVNQAVDDGESNPSHVAESNLGIPSTCEVNEPVPVAVMEDLPTPLDVQAGNTLASVVPQFSHEDDAPLEPYSSLTEDERLLGVLKPVWIPDEEAPHCMNCSQRFTVIRRRHHCRACGRVLCNNCCSSRARLEYMESSETRVCLPCLQVLRKVEAYKKWGSVAEAQALNTVDSGSQSSIESTPASSPSPHLPNPVARVNVNNPAEYCSTVPPAIQIAAAAALPTPTVMVPVGVLKKEGTPSHPRTKSEPKQVR